VFTTAERRIEIPLEDQIHQLILKSLRKPFTNQNK